MGSLFNREAKLRKAEIEALPKKGVFLWIRLANTGNAGAPARIERVARTAVAFLLKTVLTTVCGRGRPRSQNKGSFEMQVIFRQSRD
jgi:hypothetical protein